MKQGKVKIRNFDIDIMNDVNLELDLSLRQHINYSIVITNCQASYDHILF